MSLYDFMLFDEISTDDKIKELNTYIGITPKVTLPNYYWDNYGKKNTDAKRGYIDEQVSLQKTGTSVNPLENFNISYEGMSGYNGNITISIPFINKGIMFNQSDLETFRQLLTK